MYCNECGRTNGHTSGCPNYIPFNATYYCSICNEGIYDGEEYIENDCGEYAHMGCFSGTNDLLNFLGYKIKIMEDE